MFQRDNGIVSRKVGGNMVRVGDTYVRSGACGDVGDYIVVDFAVVRVKPKIYGDIGVQGFKIGYCLFIDFGLGFVCVVLAQKVIS